MGQNDLKKQYREIHKDNFPATMEIKIGEGEALKFEKVTWNVKGELKGLRYGENPHQPAALYRLQNGNLVLGEVRAVDPQVELTSSSRLLKSGKHPGMINITDIDAALNILRYLDKKPAAVVVKHNNPSGVARRDDLTESYLAAFMADPVAAFGGVVALNREVDVETAREICRRYTEVVVAPGFSAGAMEEFNGKKNIRVMEIANIDCLRELTVRPALDFTSLIDGGLVLQWAYRTVIEGREDFLPAVTEYRGEKFRVQRKPSQDELEDLLFGWQVEAGVTSN